MAIGGGGVGGRGGRYTTPPQPTYQYPDITHLFILVLKYLKQLIMENTMHIICKRVRE
jgi:hypothetical protein